MEYEELTPISRSDADRIFASDDAVESCRTLVRVAFHEPDLQWAQSKCLSCCTHPESEVRSVAATCLGHLARIHGTLDFEQVLPVLHSLLADPEDPEVRGCAEDALDDIRLFADPG